MDDQPDIVAKEIDLLRSILRDASIHIRYLHERFEQTDRGYALLAKINAILVQRKQ
jgi:hypothetical protein